MGHNELDKVMFLWLKVNLSRTNGDEKGEHSKNKLIRVLNLQQNLQQVGAFAVLLQYRHDSFSIISLYFAIINHLFTNTYKPE